MAVLRSKHHDHFRVTHYSVQSNHVHLVAEASDCQRLSRGVQGLAVRIARRLNCALDRSGALFSERYHARTLRTPREVRHALAYFDACSSAAEFDGWRVIYGLDLPPAPTPDVTAPARSFLLRRLWRRHGLIAPDEVPGSVRAAASHLSATNRPPLIADSLAELAHRAAAKVCRIEIFASDSGSWDHLPGSSSSRRPRQNRCQDLIRQQSIATPHAPTQAGRDR